MSGDAVSVAPQHYTVLLENDRVRVLESHMPAGEENQMHSHPAVVAIGLEGGSVQFTIPGGQTMEATLNAGEAMYMDAAEHATKNVGSSDIRVILVELK